jgi:peroxiredoxin
VRTLRGAGAAALLATALVGVAGCSTVSGGWTDSGEEAGYVTGDRSVTTWEAGDRTEPVQIVGTDFAGAPVDTSAWRGDVVVLNTWYAACPPCRAEIGDLVAIAEDYASQGVHLLGVNSTDEPGAAQPFEREFAVPYPSVHDSGSEAVAALQAVVPINAVPTTVVLDRQGRVAARIIGLADETTLRALIDDTLAEAAG